MRNGGNCLLSKRTMAPSSCPDTSSLPVGSIAIDPTGDLMVDEFGLVKGETKLTQPRVRKSQKRIVLSWDPLAKITPPQLYRDKIGAKTINGKM